MMTTFNLRPTARDEQTVTTRRLEVPGNDQSSVESDHGRSTGRLDKPRKSQPESGMRFTSQTGRHHHGTLDQQLMGPRTQTSRGSVPPITSR